jgi:hypothetical protein
MISKNKFILINIILFLIVTTFLINKRKNIIFNGVDGNYMVSIEKTQEYNLKSIFYYNSNFFQGLGGNIYFPLNTKIEIGYIIGNLSPQFNIITAYVTWALLLFFSIFIFSNFIINDYKISIIIAWISNILIFFPAQILHFYDVMSIVPQFSTFISLSSLLYVLILYNKKNLLQYISCFLGILFILLYLILINPTNIILLFPFIFTLILVNLINIKNKKFILYEILCYLFLLAFLIYYDFLFYFKGLFSYTGYNYFPDDFINDRTSLIFTTTFFTKYNFILFPLLILGIFEIKKYNNKNSNVFIYSLIFFISIITILSIINIYLPQYYKLPSPIYFEFFIWPLYVISITIIIIKFFELYILRFLKINFDHHYIYIFICILFVYLGTFMTTLSNWQFPNTQSNITKVLKDTISYNFEREYVGRVATFTGLNIDNQISWSDLQILDYKYLTTFGNDYRKADLWINKIPTLTEYNPLISPRAHFLLSKSFTKIGDKQLRNMIVFRNINIKLLRLYGIKYFITDKLVYNDPVAVDIYENKKVFLYKISNYNQKGYSPTNILYYNDIYEGFDKLQNPDFDPKTTVLLHNSIKIDNLTNVDTSSIEIKNNYYKIYAKSKNISIIVLPIEFSNCFLNKEILINKNIKLFPVDIGLIGILFNKTLDLNLEYKNGPFINQKCRCEDDTQFKKEFYGK